MSLTDFQGNALAVNIAIFAASAAAVWAAGTKLSQYADGISDRTGLGKAFTGLLLLSTVTSLPEIATTLTASHIGNSALVTGNLYGGVAHQTVMLAIADAVAVKGALTSFTPKSVLLLQGIFLILLLSLFLIFVIMGEPLYHWGMGLGTVTVFLTYLVFLYSSYHHERRLRGPQAEAPLDIEKKPIKHLYLGFLGLAAVVLCAGYLLSMSADAMSAQTGISSGIIGGTLVAISTSLPELSTTISAVRIKAYSMAVSNVFGGNAFNTALIFLADAAYRRGPILGQVSRSTLYLGVLGIILTCIYLWGLLEKKDKTIFRLGYDSAAVVIVYLIGLVGWYIVNTQ